MDKRDKRKKRAKLAQKPAVQKDPILGTADPDEANAHRLTWRLAHVDFAGTWGWDHLAADDKVALHALFVEYEQTELWRLRKDKRLLDIPVGDLCSAAKERLSELSHEDVDTLQELRFGRGKWRAWGRLAGSTFSLLWWDPLHSVYGETPKGVARAH